MRVLGREHSVLAGLRRAQGGNVPRTHRGEGAIHLRRLHLHSVAERGFAGQSSARTDQQEHAETVQQHVRRGATADLHVDASRLVSSLHQLGHVSQNGPDAVSEPKSVGRLKVQILFDRPDDRSEVDLETFKQLVRYRF